jgi:hypothetical protein
MQQRKFHFNLTRSSKFFRQRLIGLSTTEIEEYLVRLDTEVAEFKKELVQLSWYMRGGVTLSELLHVYSFDDREAMYSVTTDNFTLTKESGLPLV